MMRTATILFCLAASTAAGAVTLTSERDDIRGVRVGMSVTDMPVEGYKDFACEKAGGKAVQSWSDWRLCDRDEGGVRSLRAAYSEDETTVIAGHPVNLTFSFDEAGKLTSLVMATDNKARPFMRKKAHLFAEQVKRRYGVEGWTCHDDAAAAGEEAIGTTFEKEHCSKKADGREIFVDKNLFRRGEALTNFISETLVRIVVAPAA